MYMIHSKSYSFLFTLIIAFTAIFDYLFNIQKFTLHSYLSQCACKTMNRFSTTASSFITKKSFQNHAQAALDTSAIDQSADLCLVSAQSVEN